MEKITDPNEKMIAALAALCFFIPAFFGKKTEFVVFYMRQSFGIGIVFIILSLLSKIPVLGWLFVLCNFFLVLAWFFHIYIAYSGEKFEIPFIAKNVNILIEKVSFLKTFFASKQ